MNKIIINLKASAKGKPFEMEMAGNMPVCELIPALVSLLGWPIEDEEMRPIYYWLASGDGVIEPKMTLTEAGIRNSNTLLVDSDTNPAPGKISIIDMANKKVSDILPSLDLSSKSSPFNDEKLWDDFQFHSTTPDRQVIRPPSTWKKISEEEYN